MNETEESLLPVKFGKLYQLKKDLVLNGYSFESGIGWWVDFVPGDIFILLQVGDADDDKKPLAFITLTLRHQKLVIFDASLLNSEFFKMI